MKGSQRLTQKQKNARAQMSEDGSRHATEVNELYPPPDRVRVGAHVPSLEHYRALHKEVRDTWSRTMSALPTATTCMHRVCLLVMFHAWAMIRLFAAVPASMWLHI
jgi:hypothetical protein